MTWTTRKATSKDIPYLAANLREADRREIYAATGGTPKRSLTDAFLFPNNGIWVVTCFGKPEGIFGVGKTRNPEIGCPWMLATDKLVKYPHYFLRRSREWVNRFSFEFPVLVNFVHAENGLHIRWLKWCGFRFVALHEEYGHSAAPFWEFNLIRQ